MALEALDHGIDQVREQDRKHEDQQDSASTVNSCADHSKEQYGQQNVYSAAVKKWHVKGTLKLH